MSIKRLFNSALILSVCVLGTSIFASTASSSSPRVVVWAWERPENVRFLNPNSTAIAFFASRLQLAPSGQVSVIPRTQLLQFPVGSYLIAVVRIDNSKGSTAALPQTARQKILDELLRAAKIARVRELQVDFDARTDEREFYRALLTELRARMPKEKRLTMTALASWCCSDDWIRDLPVDESVAMLFSMGKENKGILDSLSKEGLRASKHARALGFCVQEPDVVSMVIPQKASERIYLFSSKPWTKKSFDQAITLLDQAASRTTNNN